MTRPTTTLTLPVSGFSIDLVTYFTQGEDDAVDLYGLGDAYVDVGTDDAGKERRVYKNIPLNRRRREIEKMLEIGIVAARKGDENLPVGMEFVLNLPNTDINFLDPKIVAVAVGNSDPKAPTATSSPSPTSSKET